MFSDRLCYLCSFSAISFLNVKNRLQAGEGERRVVQHFHKEGFSKKNFPVIKFLLIPKTIFQNFIVLLPCPT